MNPSPLDLLILALAAWRLSAMLTYERGPFGLFLRLRLVMGVWPTSETDPSPGIVSDNELARLFSCIWCLGVWISIALTLVYILWPLTIVLAVPLALSAGVVLIEKAVG